MLLSVTASRAGAHPAADPARAGRAVGGPRTLAVVEATYPLSEGKIAFGRSKIAWTPYFNVCRHAIRVLDIDTRARAVFPVCRDEGVTALVIAGATVVWYTHRGGNTESEESLYAASGGAPHLITTYRDASCAEGDTSAPPCDFALFAAGGHAYVSHAGTLSRLDVSRLDPVARLPGYVFAGASWPLAVFGRWQLASDAATEIVVVRLTDGKRLRSVSAVHIEEGGVLSSSLLAARGRIPTADTPRLITRLYDLRTGDAVETIRDELAVAVIGRRVFSLAPDRGGPRFRIHTAVPLRRLVVRDIGSQLHDLAPVGGDLAWSEVRGSRLFWIESYPQSGARPFRYGLRTLDLGR